VSVHKSALDPDQGMAWRWDAQMGKLFRLCP